MNVDDHTKMDTPENVPQTMTIFTPEIALSMEHMIF